MTVTISEKGNGRLGLRSAHPGFKFQFGEEPTVSKHDLFSVMWEIADYANNKENEECIFDVE